MGEPAAKKPHSRYETARRVLIFWTLFIGVGAVGGAACMLAKPDGSLMGMQGLLPYFRVLPLAEYLYRDYLFPGIALLCVNGLPNLAAAWLLLKRKRPGDALGGVLGVTLMLWICIQFVIFPLNFMSTIYFIFGAAQAATGYAACVFAAQERFAAALAKESFPGIGSDPSRLVVYFSRMGYTKKAALTEAARTGAEVYEIKSTERTAGTLGFWWCGRYAMHGWPMPIEPVTAELARYERVTICAPIWAFSLAGPVRAFCRAAKGKIKNVEYILTHHTRLPYENAAREMDELLGVKAVRIVSIACPLGKAGKPAVLQGGAEDQAQRA